MVSWVIFSTLTAGPSSISYRVTVGPRVNPVTCASTENWSSTPVIDSIMASLAPLRVFGAGPVGSRSLGGSW